MESLPHRCEHIESIARCVIVHEGSVLLCGALDDTGDVRYWYLPGGHIEPGETARQAVTRELVEEAGLHIEVGACVLVGENHFTQVRGKKGPIRRHEYTFLFVATAPSHAVQSLEANLRFEWVPLSELSGLDLRPTSLRSWLEGNRQDLAEGRSPTMQFHVEQS